MVRPSQRKEMALWAVQHRRLSIVSACQTFGISETCYRYKPKLSDENELIADWLLALTKARKNWGFGLCYLHLRNVRGFAWNHKRVYRIYRETGELADQGPPCRCHIQTRMTLIEYFAGLWSLRSI